MSIDWSSPTELAKDSVIFNNLMHTLIGLYIWEFVSSLNFEWQFISGKRVFRWPLTFYFLGRYCLLFALVGVVVALEVTADINCQALYIFNEVMGNASIGVASINLSLRTMAVWCQNKYIVIPLVFIILGHWTLLMQGILLHAKWEPSAGCIITETRSRLLAITFIYSMGLDFIVMCLTAWKLVFRVTVRSRLMNLIFQDGLIYFIIAFLANLLATVFMILNLNPIMSIIFNVPAAIASTVVASRAVRRLMQFAYRRPEEFTVTGAGSNINVAFRPGRGSTTFPSGLPSIRTPSIGHVPRRGGVRVQLETFTTTDSDILSPSTCDYSPEGHALRSFIKGCSMSDIEEGKQEFDFDASNTDISPDSSKHPGLEL